MLNGIVDSWKVRAQKVVASSWSAGGSSFIPRRSEDQLVIKSLKESRRQQDKELQQQDEVQR
jgi:hypothetical protein